MAIQVPTKSRQNRRFDIKTTSRGLFGRKNEVSILRSCYERMRNTQQAEDVSSNAKLATDNFVTSTIQKELIYIIGNSGVGKSSLAFSIRGDVEASEYGLFVEGKFDLLQSNEPYSGIAKAFGMICHELLSSSKDSVASVGKVLATELIGEVQTLLPLIPELKTIVDKHTSKSASRSTSTIDMGNTENRQERWKYAFRLLSRALNAAFSPMVLMLDDLQWADESSLQVIDYLVSDIQNPNRLMLIGCYRSEEVFDRHILLDSIKTLKEKQAKYAFSVTEIKLHSCELETVNELIMAMMSIENETETHELAKICYKRTLGNPFFVLQFMSLLESEDLLRYDESSNKWSWDVGQIKQRTNFISDVVELIQGRMKKFSEGVQLLLQYAACLGTSFSLSTIDTIWEEHGAGSAEYGSDLSILIEEMLYEQCIEEYGESGYKWIHDKVQEAAISLSDKVNESFKFQIGKTLVSALDAEQLEEELFDVAKYVEHGVSMLPRDCWTSHREMTLDMFTLGAEMELALGNSQAAERYYDAVFKRNDCSVMEKFPARLAVIRNLSGGDAGMKRRAFDMCLEALKELGYPVTRGNIMVAFQAILLLIGTTKATKKWLTKKGNDSLPEEMVDPRHLAIMELLERLTYISFHLELIFYYVLAICHLVKMTVSHGECDLSAIGLALIGTLAWFVLKEDFSVALTCSETAMSIQENSDSQHEGKTTWSCYLLCLCRNKQFSDSVVALQRGYKVSMRHGDTETAMWILTGYQVSFPFFQVIVAKSSCTDTVSIGSQLCIPYTMGQPLAKIVRECPQLLVHVEEYEEEQATFVKMLHQCFLSLQSNSVDNTQLEGAVFNSEQDQVTPVALGFKHLLEGELLVVFSLEMAAERAVRHGDKFQKTNPGVWLGLIEMFHRGIALYAMARKRKNRKYKSRATKIRRAVKQWIKDGTPYVEHYDLWLDAEHAALSRTKFDEVDHLYQKAIESAAQLGHLQHCALCSERYADFLLYARSKSKGAMHQLSESIRYYEEWGAMGKVNQLKLLMKSVE
ncbi:MAG: hypothetical protein SGBAC_010954 [Bacillariaceae sp.]